MISFAILPGNKTSLVTVGVKEIGPYYWVGNCKNGIDYYAGQTFQSPETGLLKRISLFSSVVYGSSEAILSMYKFDTTDYTFKEKLSETSKHISKAHENQWLNFEFSNMEVIKSGHYAFKISCKGGGMLAIAECPWSVQNPYADGVEWIGSSTAETGSFHKDFDLAFEAEIETSKNAQFI